MEKVLKMTYETTGFIYTNIFPFVYSLSLIGAATNLAVYAFKCEKFRIAFKQQWAFLYRKTVAPSTTFVPSTIQAAAKSQLDLPPSLCSEVKLSVKPNSEVKSAIVADFKESATVDDFQERICGTGDN
uniref:Uncharacterized protein n=1 Tax=Romanomermis culicivorax TaxID=13658 RepID=A0A915IXI8_ROMCU